MLSRPLLRSMGVLAVTAWTLALLPTMAGASLPVRALLAASFGALIGYCANRLAIWLLFNPVEPIRIWRLEIQGIIPKKRDVLASRVADVIATDILRGEDVERLLKGAGRSAVDELLLEQLSRLPLPPGLAEKVLEISRAASMALARELMARAANSIDLRAFVVEKACSLDPRDFSRLFHKAVGKELRWISFYDACLGAFLGLLESVLFSLLGL